MGEPGPGPRDYALMDALFSDWRQDLSIQPPAIFQKLQKSPYFQLDDQVEEPSDLARLEIPDPIFPPETDLQKESADDLITKAIGIDKDADLMKLALTATLPNRRFTHHVCKLDLPVLRTDPRHDLKAINKLIAATKQHDFFRRPNGLPLEPVDEEKDEGIGLPRSAVHFYSQLSRGAEPDEIDFDEDDLMYVAESTNQAWTDKDLQDLIQLEIAPTRERVQCMTPPLVAPPFHETEPEEAFVPEGRVCEIETFSYGDSLLESDLQQIEQLLVEAAVDTELPKSSELDVLDVIASTTSPEATTARQRIADVKMETPVLSRFDESQSPSQTTESTKQLIKDAAVAGLSGLVAHGDATDEENSDFDEHFSLLLREKTSALDRKMEQEHIQVADATARLPPLPMDFSIPEPEWASSVENASEMFRWISQHYHKQFQFRTWPRNRNEMRELRWIPFPTDLGRVDLTEKVGDDRALRDFFEPQQIPLLTSIDFVRRDSQWKLIVNDGSDDELPVPHEGIPDASVFTASGPEDGAKIMDLIKKRKIAQLVEKDNGHDLSPVVKHVSGRASNRRNAKQRLGASIFLGENETNASGKLLSNYLELRDAKRPKMANGTCNPTSAPVQSRQRPLKAPTLQPEKPIRHVAAPCPPVAHLEGGAQVVISTTLVRSIISALNKIPGIELIDRDLSRYDTTAWSPGRTSRVIVPSSLSFEADIIPSPTTGIINTTLLKVLQKVVPESKSTHNQIRQRVAKVAPLYEKLIVLVSEDNKAGEYVEPLSPSSAEAYASFVAFTSALGAETGCCVRVMYVGGGESTLATWACALVSTHVMESHPQTRQILIADETEWELFFRRAGLNIYAAQVVIAILKGSHPGNDHASLMWFLRLEAGERAKVLAAFQGEGAGGRAVMDRVSACLD